MHREQYGEYAYRCQVIFRTWFSFIHVSFRKATSVKKEESSKAKKSRRPISFKTQVRKWFLIIEGTPYLLCEGWLGDFVFTGIMISIFFSWILIKDDIILPFPSEQFFLYLNTTHEWRIKWLQCDWQTILFPWWILAYFKEQTHRMNSFINRWERVKILICEFG